MASENNAEKRLNIALQSLETPQGRVLLKNFMLDIHSGEIVLIKGKNGSGKTTLLRCMLGLWPHYKGDVSTLDSSEYLPQLESPALHMPMSLRDVLSVSSPKFEESEALEFGLLSAEQLSYNWNSASGGEKKRTLLTRILMKRPKLIFMDEPFNHLDDSCRNQMAQSLERFVKEGGSVVLVSHENSSLEFFDEKTLKKVVL